MPTVAPHLPLDIALIHAIICREKHRGSFLHYFGTGVLFEVLE